MEQRRVDVAILGAGTAGLTARRAAEKEGADALMIDPGPYGTTCARVGCMPSKLLIAAADTAWHAKHAGVFGIDTDVNIDGRRVMQRVQTERNRFVGGVLNAIDKHLSAGRLISGRARFLEPQILQIDDHTRVEARSVVIATGSSPWIPPPFRELGDVLIGNDQIFELEHLPESMLVVGAGVIGLELGQAMHRLGVRVCIASRGGFIGPFQDPKMKATATELFGRELDLHLNYELHEIERIDDGARVHFTDSSGRERTETYQYVFVSTGRRPNVQTLDLDKADIPLNEHGNPLHDDHTMQVCDSHVFLAGDVCGHRPLLHEAAEEGRIAGRNAALYPNVLAQPRTTMLTVAFTDPQIAVIGTQWSDRQCSDSRVGDFDFRNQGRARVMNRAAGRVRIYGEAGTGKLLGAEMLGPDAEHTAHLLAWAIQQGLTVSDALSMPFYHPVIEEGIRTALRDLQARLHIARPMGTPCEEFGPGD